MANKRYETMFLLGAKVNSSLNKSFSQAQNKLSSLEKKAESLNQAFAKIGKGIKAAVAAVGAYVSVSSALKLMEFSDTLAQTKSRLDLMNDGLQTTAELQKKIYESAQRSKATYNDTAQVVSRLGILAGHAFNSNEEMIRFAELMSKQFKIGGASLEEQTSAMYQLTQAMASGKLQGDEFRAIMENAPLLAQSIAKYMGKSIGELKEMSSEGQITADVIKKALFASAEETNQRFEQLPVTFGQIGTEAKNKIIFGLNPLFAKMGSSAAKLRPIVMKTIDYLIPRIIDLYNRIEQGSTKLFAELQNYYAKFIPFIKTAKSYFDSFINSIQPGINSIKNMRSSFVSIGKQVIPMLKQGFDILTKQVIPFAVKSFQWFINDIFPIMIDFLTYVAKTVIPPVAKVINFLATNVIPQLGAKFQEWMPKIATIVGSVAELLKLNIEKIVKTFETAWPYIQGVVTVAINVIGGVINGLLTTLNGVITFITGVFYGDWVKAWDGIKNIFFGVCEAMKTIIKEGVNVIISAINLLIQGLNKVKINVPNWVPGLGGKSFGINIPLIPKLEKGGKVLDRGAYIAGEKGPELITNTPGATVVSANRTQELLKDAFKGNQKTSITYAPQYIIQGNADVEKIKELDIMNQRDFERRIQKYFADKKRVSFAGG